MVPVAGERPVLAVRRRPLSAVPPDARQFAVRMRDGVRLATDVYLPSAGDRWPVLLSRLPYDKAGDECFMPKVARWFRERGYVVVVQDVRGKCRSGGDLEPFVHEVSDGYDTIEWLTEQTWCDGNVGMIGDSYYGFTQWAAAASGHPALRAITPRVSTPSLGAILNRQGMIPFEVIASWVLETWVDDGLYEYDGHLDWSIRPPRDVVPAALAGHRPRYLDRWIAGDVDVSSEISIEQPVPALHLGGFFDLLQRSQIETWQRLSGAPSQYLILDAVDHGWTEFRNLDSPFVDPQTDPTSMAEFLERYLSPLLPFLDSYLKQTGNYSAPAVRWRPAHGGWRENNEWPPRNSHAETLHLVAGSGAKPADGSLSKATCPEETSVHWLHDPQDPVPSLVHPYYPLMDPADESLAQGRADVACFESEHLSEPTVLAGQVILSAAIRTSQTTGNIVAVLLDIHPDGRLQRIAEGASRLEAPWGYPTEVDLGHAGYLLQAGHRLGLRLASSAYPQYLVHNGDSTDPWTSLGGDPVPYQLLLGGAKGASLTIHVLHESEGPL